MLLQISNAYEVLSDDQKRSIYDRYGEAGLKNGMGGMGGADMGGFNNPFDLFEQFFGASGGRAGAGGFGGFGILPLQETDFIVFGRFNKWVLTIRTS